MCLTQSPHCISLSWSSKSLREDIKVNRESLFLAGRSVFDWLWLQGTQSSGSQTGGRLIKTPPEAAPDQRSSPLHQVGGLPAPASGLQPCVRTSCPRRGAGEEGGGGGRKQQNTRTNVRLELGDSFAVIRACCYSLLSTLVKCRAGTTTGACAGDSLRRLLG